MSKRTAVPAEAGAAASTSTTATQTAPAKPAAPAVAWPPDQYTGIGGTYTRDPVTGVRTPVPPVAPADGADTAAA